MANQPKDWWDKAQIMINASVPITIFFIGLHISKLDKANSVEMTKAQTQSSLLTNLIAHLSSANPLERTVACEVTNYLGTIKQLPAELTLTVIRLAKEDSSPMVVRAATQAILVPQKDSAAKEFIKSSFSQASPRVFLQALSKEAADTLKWVGEKLEKRFQAINLTVLPTQVVAAAPSKSELRYFQDSDKSEADSILSALKALGVDAVLKNFSDVYRNSANIHLRQYEFWYGKTAQYGLRKSQEEKSN